MPDQTVRKRIWTTLGGPGTVLVDGEAAGLWRAAKKGAKLVVTVQPLSDLAPDLRDELAAEARRLAPLRGAQRCELRLDAG